jgi:hypothetical protein
MARYGGLLVLLIGILNFIVSTILEVYGIFNSYQFFGQVDGGTLALLIARAVRPWLFSIGLILTGITLMALAADRAAVGPPVVPRDSPEE